MPKQSSDKKFYIVIATVVFFGLCSLALAGSVLWSQRTTDKSSIPENTQQTEDQPSTQENNQAQTQKDLLDKCLANADRLYGEYLAKVPSDLSVEEHLMFTQQLAQTRDSQKADCDRRHD